MQRAHEIFPVRLVRNPRRVIKTMGCRSLPGELVRRDVECERYADKANAHEDTEMNNKSFMVLAAVLITAGCGNMTARTAAPETDLQSLPPTLIALVAPGQDVATARLLPDDNCYWYEHRGQVETTLLPLTTAEGRPICMQSQAST
ncbi:hypothetical protein ACFQ5P_06880 [Paracoccus nototheniae]